MSKKRAILLIGAVFVLATAGVVYAHWTETLTVDATISTGSVGMIFAARPNTDDDGVDNSWETIRETAAQEGTDYDRWPDPTPNGSSNDPSSPWAASRYTKDVARCRVINPFTADTVTMQVDNAYPSYWCTVSSNSITQGLRNVGSVPVRSQAIRVEVCESDCGNPNNWEEADFDESADRFWYPEPPASPELQFAVRPQTWCGRQWDPGDQGGWHSYMHVEQDAVQGATYQVRITIEWVNWNEWSLDNCEGYNEWGNGSGTLKYPIT